MQTLLKQVQKVELEKAWSDLDPQHAKSFCIVCVDMKGNLNWECKRGQGEDVSFCTRTLLRQKLRSGRALSPLFPLLCPLFFTLSLFLLYLHSPLPLISAFQSLTLSVKDPRISTSGWLGKNRHLLFPQTSVFVISRIWTENSSMLVGTFYTIVPSGWWWTCRSFQQASFQDVWEEMTDFQGEFDGVNFRPAIARGIPAGI